MKKSKLTLVIQKASSGPVQDAANSLRIRYFPRAQWLGVRNRYARNTKKRIEEDADPSRSPIQTQLTQYAAASIVLHCFDGWSFLSRAVACLIDGDHAAALHMAYYAELRAGMSFLATSGICIFDDKHVWFDAKGECGYFQGSTHQVVWEAISKWADWAPNSTRLLQLLSFRGISFENWLNAASILPGSPPTTLLARDWLKTWSLDLEQFANDRSLRNEVSYRPQRLYAQKTSNHAIDALQSLVQFWRACEPSSFDRFSVLDVHLLSRALASSFQIRTASKPSGKRYRVFLENALSNLGLSGDTTLREFLIQQGIAANHELLQQAGTTPNAQEAVISPLPVLARAILLLRLAAAATSDFLRASGISRSDLAFWLDSIGEQAGLWDPADKPDDLTDMWEDMRFSLENLEVWCARAGTSCTPFEIRKSIPNELSQVTRFERVGFWSVGL